MARDDSKFLQWEVWEVWSHSERRVAAFFHKSEAELYQRRIIHAHPACEILVRQGRIERDTKRKW